MKISAMKKLLLLCVVTALASQANAQFNYNYTDSRIPVVGVQYGVVGGGHSALLVNRDDIESETLQPQTMNFTYFTGVERIRWYTPHFGFGQQVLLWNGGAAYKGTTAPGDNAPTLDAKTKLTYAKIPLLFWYKSYNRWHPERRFRVNTFFGPYFALLSSAQEDFTVSTPGTDDQYTYTLKSGSYVGIDKDSVQFFDGNADDASPAKIFDYGFTMGAGFEVRLWRRTVVALTIRTDVGMTEVENKDFSVTDAGGTRYNFYQDVIGKFNPYPAGSGQFFDYNRPETRNMSFGAQLSIRKYFGAK